MPTRFYTLSELAQLVGGQVDGDAWTRIKGVAGIREAKPGDITFVANPKYEQFAKTTEASAVIATPALEAPGPTIRIDDPYYAYLKVLNLFAEEHIVRYPREIHESAVIDSTAEIGENVSIGPFCQICAGVRVGANTTILCGSFLGQDAAIGSDCLVYANVVVREGSDIGNRVILQPGVVIGSDGFGFARNGSVYHKIPQIGHVVIEDDVEIGANSCVDRATTGETRISRGVKIDNLVQIAHNVSVGEDTVIAAQAGVSGSTELGRNVTLAGQAGVVGHVTIGDNAMVGAQGGVTKSVPADTVVSGYPAREHNLARRLWAHTAQLPSLVKRVRALERAVDSLRKGARVGSAAEDD